MKTILHISKYYYPDLGGIETVAKYLAEGLTTYKNVVVCFSKDNKNHEDEVNGVKVYRVAVNFSFMSQDVAFGYHAMLKRLIKEYHPFAVHVHCPNPFVYPLVINVIDNDTKMVLHWHSDILAKGLMYKLIKPFENKALERADLIISTSPNYIPFSKPLTKHVSKVKIAQNGLITSNFDLQPGDEERIKEIKTAYQHKKIVYFVGRHVPYKGIEYLIKSEQYIKNDCVILIAGSGPYDKYLHTLPHGDKLKFLGRLSDKDLRCFSHAATIFAFPSVTKAEAFGIALAEAMYCQNVPVTFTIEGSGVNWVSIKDVTGEQVSLKNEKEFAIAIDRLLSDENLYNRYLDAAHKRVLEHFTEEKAVGVMAKIYNEL